MDDFDFDDFDGCFDDYDNSDCNESQPYAGSYTDPWDDPDLDLLDARFSSERHRNWEPYRLSV